MRKIQIAILFMINSDIDVKYVLDAHHPSFLDRALKELEDGGYIVKNGTIRYQYDLTDQGFSSLLHMQNSLKSFAN